MKTSFRLLCVSWLFWHTATATLHAQDSGRLVSAPAAALRKVETLQQNTEFATRDQERRVVALGGQVLAYLQPNTKIALSDQHELRVLEGEVFLQVPLQKDAFRLTAADRSASIREGDLVIRHRGGATQLQVLRGDKLAADRSGMKIRVGGGREIIVPTGHELAANYNVVPVLAASQPLEWTRDLRVLPPLVPPSDDAGGNLVGGAPGNEKSLQLRRYHVEVFIEDGFAMTTIDQTFFNPDNQQLEGSFRFPLPADASLSRLAMYVDGTLQEGGIVERDLARDIYESIRYARRDPALLEWVDGTTFKMRVFPIEPRTEKRIVLSYSQRLPAAGNQWRYRFPAGHSVRTVKDWSVAVRVKEGAERGWRCDTHGLKAEKLGKDIELRGARKEAKLDQDLVLDVTMPADQGAVQFHSTALDGSKYLMVKYRPAFEPRIEAKPRVWGFLIETSGDRNPLLARTQIEIFRHTLLNAEPTDSFFVAVANTRVGMLGAKDGSQAFLPVTPQNIESAVAFLEQSHLIGALDLSQALEVAKLLPTDGSGRLVHLGSGIPAMGEKRLDELAKKIPAGVQYVGVGVGKRWNRAFMKQTADATAGYFTSIQPDEPLPWRAFELATALKNSRRMNVAVEAEVAGETTAFHVMEQMVGPGEDICAIAKFGKDLPAKVRIRGMLEGKPFVKEAAVEKVAEPAGYLPRQWAKLEVDRLLAKDAAKHKDEIIRLAKEMALVTPFTSLLVLEHEDLYVQHKVDRNRKDHWAWYATPAKIPVVYEPLPGEPDPRAEGKKPSVESVLKTLAQQPTETKPAKVGQVFIIGNQIETDRVIRRSLGDNPRWPATESSAFLGRARLARERLAENNLTDLKVMIDAPGPERLFRRESEAEVFRRVAAIASRMEMRQRSSAQLEPEPDERRFITTLAPGLSGTANRGLIGQFAIERVRRRNFILPVADLELSVLSAEPMFNMEPAAPNLGSRTDSPYSSDPTFLLTDDRFFNLLQYLPGMHNSAEDAAAVVEAEARVDHPTASGRVDRQARELIERARQTGWKQWNVTTGDGIAVIRFDGQGRHHIVRGVAPGFEEIVVSDGVKQHHLYPHLGLASVREMSRFHRTALWDQLPWCVPPADDLARGADIVFEKAGSVLILPIGEADLTDKEKKESRWYRERFHFGPNGDLIERQTIRMPDDAIAARQVLGADGSVRWLDGAGKEIAKLEGKLDRLERGPSLVPETKGFVTMPLPVRTPSHVRLTLKNEKKEFRELTLAEATPLFYAYVAAGERANAEQLFRQTLHVREQRDIGYYVLLASCGSNLDSENLDITAEHADRPLAQYLSLHTSPVLRKHASQWAVASGSLKEGPLGFLSVAHAISRRWQSEHVAKVEPAKMAQERSKAFDFVRTHPKSPFAWAILSVVADKTDTKDAAGQKQLAEAWSRFASHPRLGPWAQYESARATYRAGESATARKAFLAWHAARIEEGTFPAIDFDFRMALIGKGDEADLWPGLMHDTARRFVKDKQYARALILAEQAWLTEDMPLAESLIDALLAEDLPKQTNSRLKASAMAFWKEANRFDRAETLWNELAEVAEFQKSPEFWKFGVTLAGSRHQPAQLLERLEKSVALQLQELPEGTPLTALKQPVDQLLEEYSNLTRAMRTMKLEPLPDLRTKVIRLADGWRRLDPEAIDICKSVSLVLRDVGDADLSWAYLTTPAALTPDEAETWSSLAEALVKQGDLKMATRAYRAATEAEPTNAQLVWDRAKHLERVGDRREAADLYRRIAEGAWQPRFQGLKEQARMRLQGIK